MQDDPPFNVSIGSKASVSTEIPAESTGRLLDALTDVIRPFSERRGLKADLIRLQREQVALSIAMQSRERLEAMGAQPVAIPNRVLVPLLENASLLEKDDAELAAAWSGLLTSAALGNRANHRVYTDVLSKLSPEHLQIMERLAKGDRPSQMEDVEYDFRIAELSGTIGKIIIQETAGEFELGSEAQKVSRAVVQRIQSLFERSGVDLTFVSFDVSGHNDGWEVEREYQEADLQQAAWALESLGLLKKVEVFDINHLNIPRDPHGLPAQMEFGIAYEMMTPLGAGLFQACHPEWWSEIERQVYGDGAVAPDSDE